MNSTLRVLAAKQGMAQGTNTPIVRSDRYITTRRSILAAGAGAGLGAMVAACTGRGAGSGSSTNAAGAARLQRAAETLRSAARTNRGIRVMAVSADTDQLRVADPEAYPDLRYFSTLGVDFVVPDDVADGYAERLRWADAGKYPADLILLDASGPVPQAGALSGNSAWTALPAVQAKQITAWRSELRYSAAACTSLAESLAVAVRDAKRAA